ncbi:unnamed protein product [Camellia sinensis]
MQIMAFVLKVLPTTTIQGQENRASLLQCRRCARNISRKQRSTIPLLSIVSQHNGLTILECEELTSSTRWSKAISMFEEDEWFKALERPTEREDLFKNYLVDLQKKEQEKAQEKHRQNRIEQRQYLETCGFIKVNTQWRKVQDQLEDDERCSCLEKFDRFEIFQEYIRDLEKEEEEQKRIRKVFTGIYYEHVASGQGFFTLSGYCTEYIWFYTNDLFEDVAEELEKL